MAERSSRAGDTAATGAGAATTGHERTPSGAPGLPPPETDGAVGGLRVTPTPAIEATADAFVAVSPEAERSTLVRTLPRKSIAVLCQRPGMSRLGHVFGRPAVSRLMVLNGIRIAARLDCSTIFSQVARATPAFMEKPWYDAALIDGADSGAASEASHHESTGILVGEVRLLFRGAEEAMAVVRMWEAVSPVAGCPLAARSCTRLRWAVSQDGSDFRVRAIPIRRIRRVAHDVPDFKELARTAGVEAVPLTRTSPMTQHRSMRLFVNDFFPWA